MFRFVHLGEYDKMCSLEMGPKERRSRFIPIKAEIAGSVALAVSAVAAWGCGGSDGNKAASSQSPEYVDNIGQVSSPSVAGLTTPVLTESIKPLPTETATPSRKKESGEAVANVGDWQFRLESWEEPNKPDTSTANGVPNKAVAVHGAIFNEGREPMSVARIKNESGSDLFMDLVRNDGGVLDGSRSGLSQNLLIASGNNIYATYFSKDFYLPPHFGMPVSLDYEVKPDTKDYKLMIQVLKSNSAVNRGSVYIDKGISTEVASYVDKEALVKPMAVPVNVGGMTFSLRGVTTERGVKGMIERMHIVVSNNSGGRQWSIRESASLLVYLKGKEVIYGDMGEFQSQFSGKDIMESGQMVDFPIMIGYDKFDKSSKGIPGTASKIYTVNGATVLFTVGGNLWGAWKIPDDYNGGSIE